MSDYVPNLRSRMEHLTLTELERYHTLTSPSMRTRLEDAGYNEVMASKKASQSSQSGASKAPFQSISATTELAPA